MRTPILLFFLFIFSTRLSSQQLPVLTDSDMVSPNDLGKKIGWCKIKLDASFNRTSDEKLAKYECYQFSAQKKFFTNHFFDKKDNRKKIFHASGEQDLKLLSGTLDYFDSRDHLVYRLVFQKGFIVKEYDCRNWIRKKRQTGRVRSVLEYLPYHKQQEFFACTFDRSELLDEWGYGMNNGKTFLENWSLCKPLSPLLEEGEGWLRDSYETWDYFIGFDSAGQDGKNSLIIRSLEDKPEGVGRIYQNFDAEKYRGKRVRMSGYIKTDIVKGWAGFRLDAYMPGVKEPVVTDHMYDRVVKGTSGWTKYDLVIDIPADASLIQLGMQLEGSGSAWFDNITFDIVDDTVPVTSKMENVKPLNKEPENLDFEK
ncbi:MAG TPA: hypothetical protein VI112_15275 [Bacteroidia bacterium]|jgi:hypothetical protein